MNGLTALPICPIWHVDRLLPMGTRGHMYEGRDDGSEMALVTNDGVDGGLWADRRVRGIASLRPDDSAPVVEYFDRSVDGIAAFGRAIKRLGWKGAPTLCGAIYGKAS